MARMKKIDPKIKKPVNTVKRSRTVSEYKVVDPKTGKVRIKKMEDWPPIYKMVKVKKKKT